MMRIPLCTLLLFNFTCAFNLLRPISRVISKGQHPPSTLQFITLEEIPQVEVAQSVSDESMYITSEATYSDLHAVVDLRVNVFYPDLVDIKSFHSKVLEKLKHRREQGSTCLIVCQANKNDNMNLSYNYDSNIVGTVEFSPIDFKYSTLEAKGRETKLYLMDLAVRRDARRKGIASGLLKSAEKYALNNGYDEILLHVDVGNQKALKLYEKHGYIEYPPSAASVQFTESRLHKPAACYIFLWKKIEKASTI